VINATDQSSLKVENDASLWRKVRSWQRPTLPSSHISSHSFLRARSLSLLPFNARDQNRVVPLILRTTAAVWPWLPRLIAENKQGSLRDANRARRRLFAPLLSAAPLSHPPTLSVQRGIPI
jgi:hypothetical protein